MKSFLIIAFALIAAIQANVTFSEVVHQQWEAFKLKHAKKYESLAEEKLRLEIFMNNVKKIAEHNQNFEKGIVTFELGLNHFADLLHSEFIKIVNGFNKTHHLSPNLHSTKDPIEGIRFIMPEHVTLPFSVDWRKKGAVTPVKNQGQCGSCWSFSTTGALEGQHFRKTKLLISLSEQNLIDCSELYGNNGCDGGLMDNAFKYIRNNGGIDTELSYPYEARDSICRYRPQFSGAHDRGYVDIEKGNELHLQAAVTIVGPVSVAIDASKDSFQFYKAGVYHEPACNSIKLDHGVLVVGYGTTALGKDYWIVKNSWGPSWGEEGYIKMSRNKFNQCGIATQASYPLV